MDFCIKLMPLAPPRRRGGHSKLAEKLKADIVLLSPSLLSAPPSPGCCSYTHLGKLTFLNGTVKNKVVLKLQFLHKSLQIPSLSPRTHVNQVTVQSGAEGHMTQPLGPATEAPATGPPTQDTRGVRVQRSSSASWARLLGRRPAEGPDNGAWLPPSIA